MTFFAGPLFRTSRTLPWGPVGLPPTVTTGVMVAAGGFPPIVGAGVGVAPGPTPGVEDPTGPPLAGADPLVGGPGPGIRGTDGLGEAGGIEGPEMPRDTPLGGDPASGPGVGTGEA